MLRLRRAIVPFKTGCVATCNVAIEKVLVQVGQLVCFSVEVSVMLHAQES